MSAVTRWERGAYALSALLALSSLIVLPVVRAVDPVLACAINYAGDSSIGYHAMTPDPGSRMVEVDLSLDPWGGDWRLAASPAYSVGPDGIDSSGDGDDVTFGDFHDHPLRAWTPGGVLAWPRLTLIAAGLMLALWTLFTRETLRRPRGRWAVEVCSAAWIASAPIMAGSVWILLLRDARLAASGALGVVQLPGSRSCCHGGSSATWPPWRGGSPVLTRPRRCPHEPAHSLGALRLCAVGAARAAGLDPLAARARARPGARGRDQLRGDSSIAYHSVRVYSAGPNSEDEIITATDPWGRPCRACTDPCSVGPDGVEGSRDDISYRDFYGHPLRMWTPKTVFARPRLALVLAGHMLVPWTLLTHEMLRAGAATSPSAHRAPASSGSGTGRRTGGGCRRRWPRWIIQRPSRASRIEKPRKARFQAMGLGEFSTTL